MKIEKIVILTLDSVISGAALYKIVEAFPGRVVLICSSQRYGGKYGSFLQQFFRNLSRSGYTFVEYLSFIFIYYYFVLLLADVFNKITGRKKKIFSVKQLGKKFKIPIIKAREINSPEIIRKLDEVKPDLIVSAYFDQVIKKDIINIPSQAIINIHAALLPYCRGPFPIICSIDEVRKCGVTIHYLTERLDEGPIIKQAEVFMKKGEDVLSLEKRVFSKGVDLVIEIIQAMEKSKPIGTKQEVMKGNYYSFPTRKSISSMKEREIKLFSLKNFISFFI